MSLALSDDDLGHTAHDLSKQKGKKAKGKGKGRGRKTGEKDGSSPSAMNDLSFACLPPATDKKLITQAAVKHSITGGVFVDTKLYAFSRKKSSGVVDTPKAVYANSAILRAASKYFDGCK